MLSAINYYSYLDKISHNYQNTSVNKISAIGLSSWYVGLILITSLNGSKRSLNRIYKNSVYSFLKFYSDFIILESLSPSKSIYSKDKFSKRTSGLERGYNFAEWASFDNGASLWKL